MPLEVTNVDIHQIDLKTRLPFKYGIATMTEAPLVFVRVHVVVDGQETWGIASDLLPPKWFTKVPEKPLDAEVDEMRDVVCHAARIACGIKAESAFDLWRKLSGLQAAWGDEQGYPRLLSNFGTTFIERAVIEACGKASQQTFAQMLSHNTLGVRLSDIDRQLTAAPRDYLTHTIPNHVPLRQTIGMADPLTPADISDAERLDDGLPQALTESVNRYSLKQLKVKVGGDASVDRDRLTQIVRIMSETGRQWSFSMDGNELFQSFEQFKEYWEQLSGGGMFDGLNLLFVEQPFHRDIALDANVLNDFRNWDERPVTIIDESGSGSDSLPRALELGYCGTSHKNCKGVFSSIVNMCRIRHLQQQHPDETFLMSGEDLANIGPIALLQDLAVANSLGVISIERNGHHYFSGLSSFSTNVQTQMLDAHPDLYHPSSHGWPTLNVVDGEISLESINRAPLGVGFDLDVTEFEQLSI